MYSNDSKKRRPRFSNGELAMLVNEVYHNKEVLFSKKCSTYSNEQKSRAWQAVTDAINNVCMVEPRTVEEVRRKWYYFLSDKKKEVVRQKQKKASAAAPEILYSPADLKILEILGEIDAQENEAGDGIEGLVCEVDAEALPLRSPASSSFNGDHRTSSVDEQKFLSPTVTYEEISEHNAAAINGYAATVNLEAPKTDSSPLAYDNDPYALSYRTRGQRRRLDEGDESSNNREFQMDKRRLMVQECQLQVLQGIYKQMQEDADRNRSFQDTFLDIQRQRLDLKREGLLRRKNY